MSDFGINYCVRCGVILENQFIFGDIRPTCSSCNYIHFRDPKVAAVAFIHNNSEVLLVRRAMEPEKGKWALPGGYVDANEDPRHAAIREVKEETGLEVAITRLLDVIFIPPSNGENSVRPIVIIFEATVIKGKIQPQDDVDKVEWFTPDNLPELAFKSTYQTIQQWLEEQPVGVNQSD